MSVNYNIYKADYNPNQDWRNADPLVVSFDQLNKQFDWDDALTADGKFQRVVHRSIDHLYYRDYYSNNKASFGSGNINKQLRYLEDQAYVISLPQSKFGESILPGSVAISMSMNVFNASATTTPIIVQTTWNIEDDSFGNLYIKSGYTSPFTNTLWTGSTQLSTPIAGEWPSANVYKYVQTGATTFVEDFNQGLWSMRTEYNNLFAGYLNVSNAGLNPFGSGFLNPPDHIGAAWRFSSAASSSIVIKPGLVPDYMNSYNFENGNFSISMIVMPDGTSQTNRVLLSKEGPIEELRTDENGNPYTQTNYTKSPYRLLYSQSLTEGVYKFEVDGGSPDRFASVSASINLGTGLVTKPTHVIVTKEKLTSTISIELYQAEGALVGANTTTYNFNDQFFINPSYIYIGNSYNNTKGFNGYIDNVKIFRGLLTQEDKNLLKETLGVGNLVVGNAFYNHGMMTLTSNTSKFGNILSVSCRGSHTIWETEISCTVSPGDFGMSSNPTLQQYNPDTNQYEYKPFVTGSHFKPYITSIGLYDDYGRLLVIGKLNTPIQTPNNMDTTFIVRYDR